MAGTEKPIDIDEHLAELLAIPLDWTPLMSKDEAKEMIADEAASNRSWLTAGFAYASMDAAGLLSHVRELDREHPGAEGEQGEVMNVIHGIEEERKAHAAIADLMESVYTRLLICAAHVATENEAVRKAAEV